MMENKRERKRRKQKMAYEKQSLSCRIETVPATYNPNKTSLVAGTVSILRWLFKIKLFLALINISLWLFSSAHSDQPKEGKC